jgi:hypothetical protein
MTGDNDTAGSIKYLHATKLRLKFHAKTQTSLSHIEIRLPFLALLRAFLALQRFTKNNPRKNEGYTKTNCYMKKN